MAEYEQGSSPTFYVTWADINGEAVSVVSSVITISHRWGGGTTTDVSETALIQYSGSTYYYNWNIPAAADKTTYNVKFIGAYSDGTVAVGDDEFLVIPQKFYKKKGGSSAVMRYVGDKIWTKKEKEELLESARRMSQLLAESKVEETLSKKINEHMELVKDLKESGSKDSLTVLLTIEKLAESLNEGMGELKQLDKEVSSKIPAVYSTVKELQEKNIVELSDRYSEISKKLKEVQDIVSLEKPDRTGHIISGLFDVESKVVELKDQLSDFKTFYVDTIEKREKINKLRIETLSKALETEKEEFDDLIKVKSYKFSIEKDYGGCRLIINKKADIVKVFNDQGKLVEFPFQKVINQIVGLSTADFVIDCEFMLYDATKSLGKEITVRQLYSPKSRENIEEKDIKIFAVDCLYYNMDITLEPLSERKRVLHSLKYSENIKEAATMIVDNKEDAKKAMEMFRNMEGSSGSIIKSCDGVYQIGEKSEGLIKISKLKEEIKLEK